MSVSRHAMHIFIILCKTLIYHISIAGLSAGSRATISDNSERTSALRDFCSSGIKMALTCTSAFTTKAPCFIQSRTRAAGRVALPLSPVCSSKRAEHNAPSEVRCLHALANKYYRSLITCYLTATPLVSADASQGTNLVTTEPEPCRSV